MPLTSVSAVAGSPPIGDRSAMTDETLELTSETVQVRLEVVVASAYTDDGENAHDETAGAAAARLMVREAVLVPVPAEASVAVTVMVLAPVVVVDVAVMPVSDQVVPEVFVSAAVAEPPSAERLAVTEARFALASVTEQVRVVASMPSRTIVVGENAQVEMAGFGSVTVIVAVPEAAREPVSVAVMMMG